MESIDRLSERQKECLRLVDRGYSSKQIGVQLRLSHHTVNEYLKDALKKIGVQDRREAARIFFDWERGARTPSRLGLPIEMVEAGRPVPPHDDPADEQGRSWIARNVPPMGGQRNTLNPGGKMFAVVQAAAIGLSGMIIFTIVIAAILYLLRR